MKFIARWWQNYRESVLLKQVSQGDTKAFTKLFVQYANVIFYLAKRDNLPDEIARSLQRRFHERLWANRHVLDRDDIFNQLLIDSVKEVLRCVLEYGSPAQK